MFAAGAPMSASAKNSYLVNEIAFLHKNLLAAKVRYWGLLFIYY
jgi:hypothetical protein